MPPPRKILVCRSSEIDFDAIWANLGGKIAIIFSTLVSCRLACYLLTLGVNVISVSTVFILA